MPRRFPTLRQRIIASRQRLPHSPIMKAANEGAVTFLIDPNVAKSILAGHELLVRRNSSSASLLSSSDESQSPSPDTNSNPSPAQARGKQQYANLEKPTKPTKLLQHALTNANGDAWIRQRYCISRAFAVKKRMRDVYASYAVDKAMQLIHEATKNQSPSESISRSTLFSRIQKLIVLRLNKKNRSYTDVRVFAREVAIHTLVRTVFGESSENTEAIINSLRDMVRDTLELRRNEEYSKESKSIVDKLDGIATEAIDGISKDLHNGKSNSGQECLVQRLLTYEQQNRDGNADEDHYLTRDEVVANAHSAMLAGIQTISTTLTGALLHLAEHPQMQSELKEGSLSGKDVVNETLRILPPVAGLPRKPMECDLEIAANDGGDGDMRDGNNAKPSCCPIKRGEEIVIDLLAFAHTRPPTTTKENISAGSANATNTDTTNDNDDFSTLRFDPRMKKQTQAQPWGIGKRKCPAGIISMECIGAVIEAIAKGGTAWAFANPRRDGVGEQYVDGWYKTVTYRPTLSYGQPLLVKFWNQNEGT